MSGIPEFLSAAWRDTARRNLVLTVGAGVLTQLMLVITGPFLARLLGPSGRGDLAALMLWPVVLVQLGCLAIPAALTYYVSAGAPRKATIRQGMKFAAPQAVVLTVIQVVIVLTVFDDRGSAVRDAALITIVIVAGLLAYEYGLAILQARSDLKSFNVLRVLAVGLFAASVPVLFILSAGIVAVVVCWVGTAVLVGCGTLIYALVPSAPETSSGDPPSQREMLSYGLRGLLSANSATDIVRPDQIALAIFLPSRALGIYVVGLAFTNLPYFFAKAVGLVAFPAVARESDTDVARRVAWRYLWIIGLLATVMTGILFATVWILIPIFFGEDFTDAVNLSYILLGGALFTAVRRVLAETMRGRGQPGPGTAAEIVATVWLIGAIIVLVPTIGVAGAAVALASSQLVSFCALLAIALHRGELRRQDAISSLKELWSLVGARSAAAPAVGD